MVLVPALSVFLCHRTLYGLLCDNIFPVAFTTFVGEVMAVIYITVFCIVTTDRKPVYKLCGYCAVPTVLFTVYAVLGWAGAIPQSTDHVSDVFGYVGIVGTLSFYSSPLATIRLVVRTKSASSIPIALCSAGTINNSIWTVYCVAANEIFLLVPNAICAVIGAAQVLLYIKYRPRGDVASPDVSMEITPKHGKRDSIAMLRSPSYEAIRSPLEPIYVTIATRPAEPAHLV